VRDAPDTAGSIFDGRSCVEDDGSLNSAGQRERGLGFKR